MAPNYPPWLMGAGDKTGTAGGVTNPRPEPGDATFGPGSDAKGVPGGPAGQPTTLPIFLGGGMTPSGGSGIPWGPIATAGAGLLDFFSTNSTNAQNAEQAAMNREWQSAETEKARRWSEMMRSSAYQSTVEDLRRAGLNPMLAISQGASGTPSGPQVSGVATPEMKNALGRGLASAMEARKMVNELETAEASRKLLDAQKETQNAIKEREVANAAEARAREEAVRTELPAIGAEAAVREERARYDKAYVEVDSQLERAGKIVKPLSDAAGVARDIVISRKLGRLRGARMKDGPSLQDVYKPRSYEFGGHSGD